MNFQFYCPQGHLLQGDTAHAGSAIVCPVCGIQFIIPQAVAPVAPVVPVVQPVSQPVVAAATDAEPEFELDAGTPQFNAPSSNKKKTSLDDILGAKKEEKKADAPSEITPDLEESNENSFDVFGDGIGLDDEAAIDNGAFGRKAKDLDILHIPCPRGHVLEVPRDMIGERVRCPYCKAVYTLQFERSLEARKEQAERDAVEEARLGKVWLIRAMIAGILVFLFIILMFALG